MSLRKMCKKAISTLLLPAICLSGMTMPITGTAAGTRTAYPLYQNEDLIIFSDTNNAPKYLSVYGTGWAGGFSYENADGTITQCSSDDTISLISDFFPGYRPSIYVGEIDFDGLSKIEISSGSQSSYNLLEWRFYAVDMAETQIEGIEFGSGNKQYYGQDTNNLVREAIYTDENFIGSASCVEGNSLKFSGINTGELGLSGKYGVFIELYSETIKEQVGETGKTNTYSLALTYGDASGEEPGETPSEDPEITPSENPGETPSETPLPENTTELRFYNMYADNMVIQRDKDFTLSGQSKPDKDITVTISGTDKNGAAYEDSTTVVSSPVDTENPKNPAVWKATLDAISAGGTYTITVNCGSETKQIKNVTFGDVFLLAGQSNIEREMREMDDTVNQGKGNNDIRYFYSRNVGSTSGTPVEETTQNKWDVVTDSSSNNCSAIGYYVAEAINREEGVPVGLLQMAQGGTSINYWTECGGWYNTRVYPWRNMNLAGVMFYQGEGDQGSRPEAYAYKMANLIDSYRELFRDESLPFFYIELMRIDTWEPGTGKYNHATVRQGQTEAMNFVKNKENTVFIGTLDLVGNFEKCTTRGDGFTGNARTDIHPWGKKIIADRITAAAMNIMYSKSDDEFNGPRYKSMEKVGSSLVLTFEATGDLKLMEKAQYADWYTDTYIEENGIDITEPQEFEISEDGTVWYSADAVLDGKTVTLTRNGIDEPAYARYAMKAYPEIPNLTDDTGLPATTFSDNIKQNKSIVFMGDSITDGFGVGRENSYPNRLKGMLSDTNYADYEIYNEGSSGKCLTLFTNQPYVNEPTYQEAMNVKGDIYFIKLGTNDCNFASTFNFENRFVRDYEAMIRSIRANSPGARICLMTPIDRFDNAQLGAYITPIGNMIKQIAEDNDCELLDMRAKFAENENFETALLSGDKLHPNQAGAYAMAQIVYEYLDPTVVELPEDSDPEKLFEGGKIKIDRAADAADENKLTVTLTPVAEDGYKFMMLDLKDEYGNITTVATSTSNTASYTFNIDKTLLASVYDESTVRTYKKMPKIEAVFEKADDPNLINDTLQVSDEWAAKWLTNTVLNTSNSFSNGDFRGEAVITATNGEAIKVDRIVTYSRWNWGNSRSAYTVYGANMDDYSDRVMLGVGKNIGSGRYSIIRNEIKLIEPAEYKYIIVHADSDPLCLNRVDIYTAEEPDIPDVPEVHDVLLYSGEDVIAQGSVDAETVIDGIFVSDDIADAARVFVAVHNGDGTLVTVKIVENSSIDAVTVPAGGKVRVLVWNDMIPVLYK